MTSSIDNKLSQNNITLPNAPAPAANYVPAVQSGNLLFISGQVAMDEAGELIKGKLGDDCPLETGVQAAQRCAIAIMAQAKSALGNLDRVKRIVKLTGFVNSTDDFPDHPKVINGASDLLVEIFADKGRHARSAVGVANLPFGVAVEIEAILEVEN